jgi:prophage regulatory protein
MSFVEPPDDRFLRLPDVLLSTGLTKTVLYGGVKEGTFPRPLKYGRASLWPESEIRSWKDKLKEGRADG